MIEIIHLVAALIATACFLAAAFTKISGTFDGMHASLVRAARWTARGSLAAAVVFGCDALKYFFPSLR
jgi:hypothetical protein